MSFSILTLNLWNVSEPLEPRYRALAAGLRRLQPDIVCLQEVARDPTTGRSQTELVAAMASLAQRAEGNDLAIISSAAIARTASVALPEFPGDYPRQILMADIVIEGRPLLVANTHLAYPPEMVRERKIQADALLAALKNYASTSEGTAKVLCGDFNDTADSPAVCAVLSSPEGFRDTYGACNPGRPGFTFFTQNKYVDPVWTEDQRIDYVFANSDLLLEDCAVVFDGNNGLDLVSDHFGVFCRLAFR